MNSIHLHALGAMALFHALSVASMFVTVRVGMLTSAAAASLLIWNFRQVVSKALSPANLLFLMYVFVLMASGINYALNPVSSDLVGSSPDFVPATLSFLVIPMLFFYLAGYLTGTSPALERTVVRSVVTINAICVGSGILLYLIMPDFYGEYLAQAYGEVFSSDIGYYPRLASWLGNSMILGVTCSTSIALTAGTKWPLPVRFALVVLFAIGAFLTLQRGAWFATLLALGSLTLIEVSDRRWKKSARIAVTALVLMVGGGFLLLMKSPETQFSMLGSQSDVFQSEFQTRSDALGNEVSERMHQWQAAISLFARFPWGVGLGVLSHVGAFRGAEDFACPDGNYFRILGELGLHGLIVFCSLLAYAFWLSVRNRLFHVTLGLVLFATQAVGTNVFDMYYSSFLFWLMIGIAAGSSRRAEVRLSSSR